MGRPPSLKNSVTVNFRIDGPAYNDLSKLAIIKRCSLGTLLRAYAEAGLYEDRNLLDVTPVPQDNRAP